MPRWIYVYLKFIFYLEFIDKNLITLICHFLVVEVPESMLKEILLQKFEKKILQRIKSKSKGLV